MKLWHSLEDELSELERTDPFVRKAADELEAVKRKILSKTMTMNPVDLVTKMAAVLEKRERAAWKQAFRKQKFEPSEELVAGQAFLAAQPVVVEVGECEFFDLDGLSPLIENEVGSFRLEVDDADARMKLDDGEEPIPCTVHVIVTPGAR